MNSMTHAVTLALAAHLVWAAEASAQEEPEPHLAAIDAYLCNYRDGKGPDQLMAVVEKWGNWMDQHSSAPYSAWVMHPVLSSVNTPIDVAWLGAWPDGNAMGKGMQEWADKGQALNAEFMAVLDCGEHSQAASLNIRPPAEGWPGKTGVVAFANCHIGEGATLDDALGASQAWASYLYSTGSKAGMWVFFPGAGNDNPEWSYKLVVSHPDYESYGADWEHFSNGGGWRKAQELGVGSKVRCDSPRVYQSVTVRDAGVGPSGT
jgi:hypothetical protein